MSDHISLYACMCGRTLTGGPGQFLDCCHKAGVDPAAHPVVLHIEEERNEYRLCFWNVHTERWQAVTKCHTYDEVARKCADLMTRDPGGQYRIERRIVITSPWEVSR